MTNDELDALEALANAATPGPWRVTTAYEETSVDAFVIYNVASTNRGYGYVTEYADEADAAYIAAANPAVVLALIARIRELEAINANRPSKTFPNELLAPPNSNLMPKP